MPAKTSALDWKALDAHILDRLTESVRDHAARHPGDHIYGAAFHVFYGETGGVVAWPALAIATEEDLVAITAESRFSPDDLRWSPADWSVQLDPSEQDDAWAAKVETHAVAGDDAHWEKAYDRFLRAFAKAAKKARGSLAAEGVVEKTFIAVAMDEAWELVPLSLTPAQVRAHFPELDEETQELARVTALPPREQAAALGEIVDAFVPGAVSGEDAVRLLVQLGPDAAAVAVERMPRSRDRWRWAKVLADTGIADDSVIEALTTVMKGKKLSEPDRAWAAAALARLGRLDVVLAEGARVPRPVLRRALAAPFTSFRDHAVTHIPLDYTPLEEALATDAALAEEMLAELAPGSGYCAITPAEVDTARAALASPFEVIRRHARIVLEDARAR
ncbi:DUF4303 domain-containing protein [Microbacterium keratanolyticum]|uniref:DUF4303 domain-containing protein n=1 Tax=Microbacterium keratanolyticum TaxID=67574 RepID=UPI0036410554